MSDLTASERTGFEVAVIAIAGRFPGACDVDAFWSNLCAGREGIRRFDAQQLAAAGVPAALQEHPDYVPASGYLDDVALFDAARFGITAREAERMDPQHRLFLELAFSALAESGIDTGLLSVGVFGSCNISSYLFQLPTGHAFYASDQDFEAMLGNDKDYLPARVAYRLDLRGPAQAVQTACSSSLVAVHSAIQALLAGECDAALAGGTSIVLPQDRGYLYRAGTVASPDGHCRPFDADAAGTVVGNGGGVVLLRRLEDAERAGDPILAVLRGSAVNNDGGRKASFTAPRPEGQQTVIAAALAAANAAADSIVFVEAHGTATKLGDPIEVASLRRAFALPASAPPIWLGSLKSNLGHMNAAAGVASLIKAVLVLQRHVVPPTLHYRQPNPQIDFGPFVVNAEAVALAQGDALLRACVSSFGMGGTNAHVVLEQAPPQVVQHARRPLLFAWSARSQDGLNRFAAALRARLTYVDGDAVAVSAGLLCRAADGPFRAALVAEDLEELRDQLTARQPSPKMPAELSWSVGVRSPSTGLVRALRELPAYRERIAECGAACDAAFAHLYGLLALLRGAAQPGQRWQATGLAARVLAVLDGTVELSDALSGSFPANTLPQPPRGDEGVIAIDAAPARSGWQRSWTSDAADAERGLLELLAELWCGGALHSLAGFAPAVARRVCLPAPALERVRYWIDASKPEADLVPSNLPRAAVVDLAEARAAVMQAFTSVLGEARLSDDDDFFALGGESLQAVRLCELLTHSFGREIAPELLFQHPAIGALAARLIAGAPSIRRSAAEAALSDEVIVVGTPVTRTPRRWLITGASGFLGSHVLAELLARRDVHVTALVRGSNEGEARARLIDTLCRFLQWQTPYAERLDVVVGDVAAPRLGLVAARYEQLAREVDGVLHAAAQVHFAHPFAELERVNVHGVGRVLEFVTHSHPKLLHHVSTAAVFESPSLVQRGEMVEERALSEFAAFRSELRTGYQQSKWVGEQLVEQAVARGVSAMVHRPGSVWGHTASGLNNPADLTVAMLIGCAELAAVPDWAITIQPAPVDYVASAIAALAYEGYATGYTHLVGPEPGVAFAELVRSVQRLGFELRTLRYDAWRELAKAAVARDPRHRLGRYLPVLGPSYCPVAVPIASVRTRSLLEPLGVRCPSIDERVLRRYFEAFGVSPDSIHHPVQGA